MVRYLAPLSLSGQDNNPMRKSNSVQFRVTEKEKETMLSVANDFGLTMSDLFAVLAFQNGPKEFVRIVTSTYGMRLLDRLGLSHDAVIVLQKNPETTLAFSTLFRLSLAVEMSAHQEDFELSNIYQKHLEKSESAFYRAYGQAIKNPEEEVVEGNHVSDND